MRHILLVDDDKDCLTALANRLRFAFRGQNLEVDVADSAAAGLILAYAAHYDAIIVDLLLPGVSGIKFVEQLRLEVGPELRASLERIITVAVENTFRDLQSGEAKKATG